MNIFAKYNNLSPKDLEHSLGLQGALEHELLNLETSDE
jgi:hypothetical protein